MPDSFDPYQQTTQTIRTSYRLLHDYQRLILDSCQYIGARLNLTYSAGKSEFSNPVSKNNTDLKKWAWDWLPFYSYQMAFQKEHAGAQTHLSMIHIADTAGHATQRDKRTETEAMGEVAESHSLLVFVYHHEEKGEQPPAPLHALNCHYPNDREKTLTTRKRFLSKCVLNATKQKAFKQDGLCILPVLVEDILTQERADQVITRLQETFCALATHQQPQKVIPCKYGLSR